MKALRFAGLSRCAEEDSKLHSVIPDQALNLVTAEFRAAAGAQVGRVDAIVAENAVHLMGGAAGHCRVPGRVGARGRARARR